MHEDPEYPNRFAGVIVDNIDPEKRGRIKAQVPDLFLDPETGEVIESPWCECTGSWGAGVGLVNIPPAGAPVWVSPVYDDDGQIWQLVYEPGRVGAVSADESHLPPTAREVDDETSGGLKAGASFTVPAGKPNARAPGLAAEVPQDPFNIDSVEYEGLPQSPQAATYPENRVLKTPGGVVLEIDDTPGAVRIHIWHPVGSYVEIDDHGVWNQRQTKKTEQTMSQRSHSVGADDLLSVLGDRRVGIRGNHIEDVTQRKIIKARDLSVQTRLGMLLDAKGSFSLKSRANARMQFVSDRSTSIGGEDTYSALSTNAVVATSATVLCGTGLDIVGLGLSGVRVAATPMTLGAAVPVALHTPLEVAFNALLALLGLAFKAVPGGGPGAVVLENPASLLAFQAALALSASASLRATPVGL